MSETPSTPTNLTAPEPQAQRPGLSDERLMLAFTQGSSEAFSELFHRYQQPVYGFFCRRVSDPANAEELTQETFFALLRATARYEPRALFRTYLYAIGFKILRAHRRKAAFRAAFLGQGNSRPDPAKQDATEAGLGVRRAVEKLDPLEREIVMLREFEQLSYGEIADLLDVDEEIARVRGEIEQMEAEQKNLEHRVDFAGIDLKLAEQYRAQLTTPAPSVLVQLRNASINGFRDAFESLLTLALFLAESGPSILLWFALLGIPAWRLWRRYPRTQSLGANARA